MTLLHALLLRGAFNVMFALYLLLAPSNEELHGLGRGGYYAFGDGLLALGLAVALFRDPRGQWLLALALVDALVRLAFGAMILAIPNIHSFILFSALFSAAVITAFIALGVFGMGFVAVGRRMRDPTLTLARTGASPAFVASACTLLFGIGLIVGTPGSDDRQVGLGAYALATGLTLVFAGMRRPQDGLWRP